MNAVIETERLLIDRLRESDRENYFINISHDREVLKTFVCMYWEDLESFDFGRYVVRDDILAVRKKESGELIGIIVESDIDPVKRSLEIGYGIGSSHWHKGYMTEAVRALIGYYFRENLYDTVFASFFPENIASRHVMEKCGMVYSHTCLHEFVYLGKPRDLIYYRIDRQ